MNKTTLKTFLVALAVLGLFVYVGYHLYVAFHVALHIHNQKFQIFLFVLLAFVLFSRLVTKTGISKRPITKKLENSEDSSSVDYQNISIPLMKVARPLRFESKFNIIYKFIIFGLPILFGFLFYQLTLNAPNANILHAKQILYGGIFVFIYLSSVGIVLLNMWQTKKSLRGADPEQIPALILDQQGIKIPLLLIAKENPHLKKLVASGNPNIFVSWKNIQGWVITNQRRRPVYMLGFTNNLSQYLFQYWLKIDDSELTDKNGFLKINRPFSQVEEERILNFAQHFLATQITQIDG